MPNRFIFSLRYANHVFAKLLKATVVLLGFLSLFRINLYFLSVHFHLEHIFFGDVVKSLWVGFGYDLLLFSFIFVPVVLLLLLQSVLEWWPTWSLVLYKIYIALIWFGLCLLNLLDFSVFSAEGHRMSGSQYQSFAPSDLISVFDKVPRNHLLIFSVVTLLLLILGLVIIKELVFGYWKDQYSPDRGRRGEIFLRLILPLALVGLGLCGNPDNRVSQEEIINQMALNPVWGLDK